MWDHETEVIVIGYGAAGGSAALTAFHAGAQVILLEKNPEGGGNTRYSGGTMRTYLDLPSVIDYFETICEGATERSVIEAFVHESHRNADWIVSIGGEIAQLHPSFAKRFPTSLPGAAFPSVRGAEGTGPRIRVKGAGTAAGIDVYTTLSKKISTTGIKVMCGSPARELVYDREAGVIGVVARQGERELRIRARRGVVMTCGGFEYNQDMHINYLGQRYYAMCNPANTGDGHRMAAELGAEMWHMTACAASMGYKFPEFEFAIRQMMSGPGFLYVDQSGSRYMNETGTDTHIMWAPTSIIDTHTLQRPRNPSYVIFDEDTRLHGPIAATFFGKVSDVYQWSPDNGAEIRKGWIKAGATAADLAPQIGMRPEQLQATIARYNLDCVSGYDPAFGRSPELLVPLGRPPYYAAEMRPTMYNTQGGPKRNARAQVINVRGQPIKRLYSAGEFGSLWHRNYPGAGNVSEALAFGRIAGRNVAAEHPS